MPLPEKTYRSGKKGEKSVYHSSNYEIETVQDCRFQSHFFLIELFFIVRNQKKLYNK